MEQTQNLVVAGYLDGNLNPTQKAKDEVLAILVLEKKAELAVMAAEEITESEKVDRE